MDSKKLNIFSLIMVVVMCVFTIGIAFTFKGEDGTDGSDGSDGKSAYELAVENGYSGSEVQYLQSLCGSDGTSVTLTDLYEAYLSVNNKNKDDTSYYEFIMSYFDELIDIVDETTQTELISQSAMSSTVDICYSTYYEMITGYKQGNTFYASSLADTSNSCVGAGSGVIYKMEDSDPTDEYDYDTAYIITNYHVLYLDYYITEALVSDGYRVYYDENTGEYFTGTYDSSWTTPKTSYFPSISSSYSYTIDLSEREEAPEYQTHFLETYNIYVYGYQDAQYAISATYVGGSADYDIAVLKVELGGGSNNSILFNGNYFAASIGDSTKISAGEGVIAVGNSLIADLYSIDVQTDDEYIDAVESAYIDALCLAVTSGVVSNTSEYCIMSSITDSSTYVKMRLIRVDAAINSGNSGGGLYDMSGRVIGIVNAKIANSEYDNVGYAIPINIATRIADAVIKECDGTSANSQIKVTTSEALGISVTQTTKSATFNATWDVVYNVVIESVSGIAASAGLQVSDIIESVTIAGTTYTLNADYDLDDVLLALIYDESATAYDIVFNITRDAESLSKTITITSDYFSALA